MPRSSAPTPDDLYQMLASALDHLVDGLMIVTADGQVVKQNTVAADLCAVFPAVSPNPTDVTLPKPLWDACHPIFHNLANGLKTHFGLEVDVLDPQQCPLRVRIQVLDLQLNGLPCLLLVLEDRQATYQRQALTDARRFNLTPREREVWTLRLQGSSYDAISTQLWITENTVKKHMKSILAKRRLYEDQLGRLAC